MSRLVALVIGLVGLIVLVPVLAMGAIANADDPTLPVPNGTNPTEKITVTVPPPPPVTVTAPPVLDGLVKCNDFVTGGKIRVVCKLGALQILNVIYDIPEVEVPLPEISEITEFVTLPPLPQVTDIVRVPVPGPTVTNNVPGPTSTVTIPGPAETVTESITESPGQGGTTPGTIDPPDKEDPAVNLPEINLSLPQAVGLGVATVLVIMALILAGMYGGYYTGHRDGTKEEVTFLRALLGKNK